MHPLGERQVVLLLRDGTRDDGGVEAAAAKVRVVRKRRMVVMVVRKCMIDRVSD